MRTIGKLIVSVVFVFAVLQLVRPSIPVKPAAPICRHLLMSSISWRKTAIAAIRTSDGWRGSIRSCQRNWLVRYDVLAARQSLNFSTLGSKPAAAQKAAFFEAVNMIQLGAMPCQGSSVCTMIQK
jgi:hypothetical protein